MRLWKAFGGVSLFLLWFSVFVGPASVVFLPFQRLVSYRRETGIWFFVMALVHGYLILDGWVRFSVWQFFGYQYIPQAEMYLRVESGFGMANLAGLIALVLALMLCATSCDRAVKFLGISSWKWLHTLTYAVFYLAVIHVVYFAFIHYTPSLVRVMQGAPTAYPGNPLKYYYLFMFTSVVIVQVLAFIKIVKKGRGPSW